MNQNNGRSCSERLLRFYLYSFYFRFFVDLLHMLFQFLFISHITELVKNVLLRFLVADTAVLHMVRIIMGIIYTRSPMYPDFQWPHMGILQMHRNGCLLRLHAAHGFLYGIYCRIALGCTGHVCNCLGKNDLGLRHSHTFHCLCCCRCHAEGLGIVHFRYLQKQWIMILLR